MPSPEPPSQTATASKPTTQETSRPTSRHVPGTSAVEMETIQTAPLDPLPPPSIPQTAVPSPDQSLKQEASSPPQSQSQSPTTDAKPVPTTQSTDHPSPSKPSPPTLLERLDSDALGPASDSPTPKPDLASGPVVIITLLLTASGARHPYKIDEKYLKKRNVKVEGMDPYNISVYTLKELIWRDWREEWEQRPTSPSSIRLIHFGRMLDDKVPLKECRFQIEAPNVVHMTVKPQEVVDEEDAKTGKAGSRRDGDEEEHAGCRCVIL